ncbi:MAG: metallophosphoesterase [Granulosicoccus sp.]
MKYRNVLATALLLAATSIGVISNVHAGVKVAFIGDQGNNSNSRAVLTLVANEDTDLLLIQGDLGYAANAAKTWDANITNALGKDFPVLTVVGNHENFEWPTYKRLIQERIDRNPALDCIGDTGVKALCQFANIDVVQVASGITEVAGVNPDDNYADFISTSYSSLTSNLRWRICSWHKNQRDMQPASKGNSTGWEIYDACLDAGAIIAMAHAHAYSRTHLLSDFAEKTVISTSSNMTLKPGQSFAFVSGLGGRDVVPQEHGGDWFASIYTASQGATHGALFCTFEITTADCYFKAIDGAIPDSFTLTLGAASLPDLSQLSPTEPNREFVFSRTDVDEFRWIDIDAEGQLSSTWIDSSCAEALGGPTASGDWDTLITLAPSTKSIETPCDVPSSSADDAEPTFTDTRDTGYVFSRTDTSEYRWIDKTTDGRWGSIWIDENCANYMGGAVQFGNWEILSAQAPAFDAIENPCPVLTGSSEHSSPGRFNDIGYVFSRTDKEELRWIARDNEGRWGSIWINQECSELLGGPKASGDWFELMREAPGFDSIPNPCL